MKERYADLPVASCRDGHVHTVPAGTYAANAWGLHDMLGNVLEWTEDRWSFNGSYEGAPSDGSARQDGWNQRRVLRGGSWDGRPLKLRAAYREMGYDDERNNSFGFVWPGRSPHES